MQENQSSGFPTRSDTNLPIHPLKKNRSLKLWIKIEEELYYLCSESKGADQLCSYCTDDQRLGFCMGKNPYDAAHIGLYSWACMLGKASVSLEFDSVMTSW